MLPQPQDTPCPPSLPSHDLLSIRPEKSVDGFEYGDETSKVDFTTHLHSTSLAIRPGKRTNAVKPKRLGKALDFAIHQDEAPATVQLDPGHSKSHASMGEKKSTLAQPAQRLRSNVNLSTRTAGPTSIKNTTAAGSSHQTTTTVTTETAEPAIPIKGMGSNLVNDKDRIKRPARRGTVYIPSEDTTMPTVWMGVFSPIKAINPFGQDALADQPADLTGLAARMAKKRAPRPSTIMTTQRQSPVMTSHQQPLATAAPRRGPLRHSVRPLQETTIREDIPGCMTGKENLPPGHEVPTTDKTKKGESPVDLPQNHCHVPWRSVANITKKPRPSSSASEKRPCESRSLVQSTRPDNIQPRFPTNSSEQDDSSIFARLCLEGGERKVIHPIRSKERLAKPMVMFSAEKLEKVPAKLIVPGVIQPAVGQTYPLLSEDIQNSSMYEDNWLAHQEIAITQLINSLFEAARNSADIGHVGVTRSELLASYQNPSFVLLQKRVQASLLYGSLMLSKETLTKSSRLPDDLGMKQRFLSLWLDTYDLQTLQACAEVVIGHECCCSPRNPSSGQNSDHSLQKNVSRQKLSRFLDIFLIRNKDTTPHDGILNVGITGVQRTLLRSLMLIKLLDTAKTSFSGCLFQTSSTHKSSVSVIQALAQLLHPSAGDIVRSLNHLEYSVSRIQDPLEEYEYRIDNLAIDLRDGVRLTRLVELLLYPSASRPSQIRNADATETLTTTTPEILSATQGEKHWPLSQHLKFPCLGRATKLHNVQIALGALSETHDDVLETMIDIKPDHIVDGFREKTVALLWTLVSKWGLGALIDWDDLQQETRRLGGSVPEPHGDGSQRHNDFTTQKSLLREWAAAAAAKKGVAVHNLTTSFADGSVYAAIVDEYEPYLIHASEIGGGSRGSGSGSGGSKPNGRSLSQRLTDLGCSVQFASLFASPTSHIPSADSTVSALSFLSSRLLLPSKRARAVLG